MFPIVRNVEDTQARRQITGRLVLGLLVIALGVVFLLDQLHVLEARRILRYAPAVPLVLGIMLLAGIGYRRHVAGGLLLTFFSGWFLLRSLGVLTLSPWNLWPVVLLVLGGWLVVAALRGPASQASVEQGASTLQAFALWSGSGRKVVSEDFRGGEVTAIMGGHEIDLRSAKMASGTAVIDLFVWWGGVELRVPRDWKVTNEALALLGGVEDSTEAPEGEVRGHLVLKGPVIMGGVEVKN
jgi:predicted membrane protein